MRSVSYFYQFDICDRNRSGQCRTVESDSRYSPERGTHVGALLLWVRCAIARTVRRATRQTQRDRQKELTALAAVEAGRQLKSRDRSGPRGAHRRTRGRRRGRECTPPSAEGPGKGQPGAGRVRGGGPTADAITWPPGCGRELDLIIARRYRAAAFVAIIAAWLALQLYLMCLPQAIALFSANYLVYAVILVLKFIQQFLINFKSDFKSSYRVYIILTYCSFGKFYTN